MIMIRWLKSQGTGTPLLQEHIMFNELPKNIRQLNKENTFKSETKKYFYDRVLARFT